MEFCNDWDNLEETAVSLLADNKQLSLLDQEETYAITSGRHVSTDQNQWLYCMGKPQT